GVGVRECLRGAGVDADRPHLVEQCTSDSGVVSADCKQTPSVRCPGIGIDVAAFDRSCQHAKTGTVRTDDGELGMSCTQCRECQQASVGRPDQLRCLLGESDLVGPAVLLRSYP